MPIVRITAPHSTGAQKPRGWRSEMRSVEAVAIGSKSFLRGNVVIVPLAVA
jgi:hypothetical protein